MRILGRGSRAATRDSCVRACGKSDACRATSVDLYFSPGERGRSDLSFDRGVSVLTNCTTFVSSIYLYISVYRLWHFFNYVFVLVPRSILRRYSRQRTLSSFYLSLSYVFEIFRCISFGDDSERCADLCASRETVLTGCFCRSKFVERVVERWSTCVAFSRIS